MYRIDRNLIVNTIKEMIMETTRTLSSEVIKSLETAFGTEKNKIAKSVLSKIIENQKNDIVSQKSKELRRKQQKLSRTILSLQNKELVGIWDEKIWLIK